MDRSHSISQRGARAVALATSLVLAFSGPLSLTPLAAAATSSPSFIFSGAGYGHGIGMSQYGAKAYASRGKTAEWIVAHYYPGTTLITPTAKTIRVNLDPSASYGNEEDDYNGGYTQTKWSVRAGWAGESITVASSTKSVTLADSGSPYSFEPSSTKVAVADRYGKSVSGSPFSGAVTITMNSSTSLALLQVKGRSGPFMTSSTTPSTDVRYRGLLVVRSNGTRLKLYNKLPMESYLNGVVPRESPASWPAESLKAQAIAARSYAYVGSRELYCDTRSQMYNGYSHGTRGSESGNMHEDSRSNAAIQATAGRCLDYKGDVIAGYFSSSSGGYTANKVDVWGGSEISYLRGVPDPYESSSYDPWSATTTFSGLQIAEKIAKKIDGRIPGEPDGAGTTAYVKSLAIHRAWPSGFAKTVDITWSTGAKSSGVSASTFRGALGLRSTKYFVNANGGRLDASDRYERSVAASKRAFLSAGDAKSVIVANGEDSHYADAASAAALAGVADGPVLLVRKGSIPSAVTAEIKRLAPGALYIIGDAGAVSSTVGTKLKALVPATTRLGGNDRYKTSAAVARKAVKLGANAHKAVVCSGVVWSDAAIAAAIAGGSKRPLLLTAKSSLSAPSASALTDLKVTSTTVVGGSSAIAPATITSLCRITRESAPTKRFGMTGSRYDTAVSAAKWSVSSLGYTSSTMYVASGVKIPDAFIAAGLAAAVKHPVLLTSTYTPSSATRTYVGGQHAAIKSVTIIGSPATIGIACALQLQSDGH